MVDFKELIELFVIRCIPSIKGENEIPNINFIFDNNGMRLFDYVKKKPFKKEGYWTPSITDEDLKLLKPENNRNSSSKTIIIKDPVLFFELLVDIVNEQIKLLKSMIIIVMREV